MGKAYYCVLMHGEALQISSAAANPLWRVAEAIPDDAEVDALPREDVIKLLKCVHMALDIYWMVVVCIIPRDSNDSHKEAIVARWMAESDQALQAIEPLRAILRGKWPQPEDLYEELRSTLYDTRGEKSSNLYEQLKWSRDAIRNCLRTK